MLGIPFVLVNILINSKHLKSNRQYMIRDFYHDKVILLTGATGFLGKVVLEKLFRSVQTFKRIYLLVRPKRGVAIMDRVKREIF